MKQNAKAAYGMGEKFANHLFDKRSISQIIQELLQLSNKTQTKYDSVWPLCQRSMNTYSKSVLDTETNIQNRGREKI